LGFKERENNYKCVPLEINYVTSQKKVARIIDQGFVCSWA